MDTDQVTQRMRAETGHDCLACPTAVRALYAAAHNASGAIRAMRDGTGSWDRALRKATELERALADFQPHVDGHFAAFETWRKP